MTPVAVPETPRMRGGPGAGTRGSSRLGLGCAPIGNLFAAVPDDDARATVDAAWERGVRFFDVAPLYGHGLAERRLGAALTSHERDAFVVSTKVGRLLRPVDGPPADSLFVDVPAVEPVFDFSRDGVLRSVEASLDRLGLDRLDVVHVHDPDDHAAEALAGAFPTLVGLREEGVVGAVGCGMNQWELLARFVAEVDLDVVLLAGRYTLLDRSGAGLLAACADRGVGVVLGGVFNTGLLVDPDHAPTYDYAPAPGELVDRALRMRDVCTHHGVSLPAAALGFGLRHPAVSSVLVGARSADEVHQAVDAATTAVPDELWATLDAV